MGSAQLEVRPATMLRRVLAVVVDFLVLYVVWVGVGFLVIGLRLPVSLGLGVLVFLVAIDLPLTAAFGSSVGRFVAGVRTIRLSDGRAPGPRRAALRILLVVLTGAFGLVYWNFVHGLSYWWGRPLGPYRLWWDAAAGTVIVRSNRWGRPPELPPEALEPVHLAVLGGETSPKT